MYREMHNAVYNFIDFFIREFTKELIGAIFSIKFPILLLRLMFWMVIYMLLVFTIFLMKLHGKILKYIVSYINKYHKIAQPPLLKCSEIGDKGILSNIMMVEVTLTTFKTHMEMCKVIHVLRNKWTWVALMCVPIVRFISVKNDDVKKIEDENMKHENVKGENEFNWKIVIFSSELLNKIIPKYLLFYKNRIMKREEKSEQIIIKRKNSQETDNNQQQHQQQHHYHYNRQYQSSNQEIICLDYWNLLFLIGIQLYGIIVIMSFRILYHLLFYIYSSYLLNGHLI